MDDVYFRKQPGGVLVPADEDTVEQMKSIKNGTVMRAPFKRMQESNYRFLKKMHALAKLAYDYFVEHNLSQQSYKGRQVVPDYDRFRKELTILAGHYTPVFNIRGEVRLEATSWSFGRTSDAERERIFSDLINAALKNVLRYGWDEKKLRAAVDNILAFD